MAVDAARRSLRNDTLNLVRVIVAALDDKKAEDITTLNVGAVSSVADVFVLASGTSQRHVATLVDEVLERVRDIGLKPFGIEGKATGWALIDFGDVVVHLFDRDTRSYYDLERLWLDAPPVKLDDAQISAVS